MTIDKFLTAIEVAPFTWCLRGNGLIRTRGSVYHCPISALTGGSVNEPYIEAQKLKLNDNDQALIQSAADNDSETIEVWQFRKRLLKACRLD